MDEFITPKKIKTSFELVLDCVVPYIQENDDLNSVSLVSKKFLENDSLTRKHVTVRVHFLPNPKRLSLRFPNLESLTLKSYSHGFYSADECSIPVAPWIHEIGEKFECLNSLSIRNMVVSSNDLRRLAKTRGGSLRSLEICGCRMDSEDGLVDIARYCKNLRNLRLDNYYVDSEENGNWLRELALCNTVMESLYYHDPFDDPENMYSLEDVTRLAKKCSGSLVSLDVLPNFLSDFKEVFKHAKKLEHFGTGIVDQDQDREYRDFKFPRNIRGLRIDRFNNVSYGFLYPYLNQLRELELQCGDDLDRNCQCLFSKRCPNLEVLNTDDTCGDMGFQFIGQFCKKLHKLTHSGPVTNVGLKAVAQGCPHLDYLKVKPFKISNEALKCVGNHLKKLRDFRITVGRSRKLDKGLRAMLEGCRKLERLDIHLSLDRLTGVGLGYIGEYGLNLRHLSLSYTGESDAGESDAGLLELLKGCPKLRKLKLRGCPYSEQAIAISVFNLNHSLRHVCIDRDYPAGVLVLTRPMVFNEIQMGESRKEKASEAERSRLDDFSEDNLQEVACLSRSDDHTPEDKEDYEGGVESKVCRNEKKCKADIFAVEGLGKLHEDKPGSGRSQCADKATSVTDESLQDEARKENPTKEE